MEVIRPKIEFVHATHDSERVIAKFARICYQTEPKGGLEKDRALIRSLCKNGHTSQIEHAVAGFIITTDRGITHELVRSRVGVAYSQESTRYVKYKEGMIVLPPWDVKPDTRSWHAWEQAMHYAKIAYDTMIEEGHKPQVARDALPTCLKTQIGVTMNFRAWRWFLALRASPKAHPKIVMLAFNLWDALYKIAPSVFETIPTVAETQQEFPDDEIEFRMVEDVVVRRDALPRPVEDAA